MKQFEQVVANDPLKLKKYDTGNASMTKRIYICLVAIPVFLILTVLFWGLSSITASSGGAPSPTPSTSSDGTSTPNVVSTANLAAGDMQLDKTKIANSFDKLSIGLRIMPSQNDEQGMIIMKWTNEKNAQESKLGEKVDVGDHYFQFNQTENYFPVLRMNADYVPMGSASPLCIHLQWYKYEMMKMIDMYKTVQGFPTCSLALNPKFRWQQNDPKTGVDFRVWKQTQTSGTESECNKLGGFFKEGLKNDGTGKCYTYMVIKRICLMVAYQEHPETASYTWEYRGGCYEGGEIAVYEKAGKDEEYKFDFVPIEVREDESLYTSFNYEDAVGDATAEAIATTKTTTSSYSSSTSASANVQSTAGQSGISSLFSLLSTLSILGVLISVGLFGFFYYKAWKAASPGGNMKHQEQVDEQ